MLVMLMLVKLPFMMMMMTKMTIMVDCFSGYPRLREATGIL